MADYLYRGTDKRNLPRCVLVMARLFFAESSDLDFVGGYCSTAKRGIPFEWLDYLKLLDWTGRAVCNNKRGYIGSSQPPILDRLGLDEDLWLMGMTSLSAGGGLVLTVERIFMGLPAKAA